VLILMAGLPGSGKSTLARALAERLHGHVLDKDRVREALFAPDQITYTREQDDFVMQIMFITAAWLWQQQPELAIFLDGRPFAHTCQVDEALHFAEQYEQPCRILECVCFEETARQRLTESHPAANRDFSLYQRMAADWQPITRPKIVIDTDQLLSDCLSQALAYITSS
jgi:adenylylsulfate kinase